MNNKKMNIHLKGDVLLPLKIGQRAVIFQKSGDTKFTSLVEAINQVADGFIVFETENTVYSVDHTNDPQSAAIALIPVAA